MIDDEDYESFIWISEHIDDSYDKAILDPWKATAFTAITGKKVFTRIHAFPTDRDNEADKFLENNCRDSNFLKENDILFIVSSHVVKSSGDVNYLILEVLPRLNPGVIIHMHDIRLPYEVPKLFIVDQARFFTEQYLLQAFLIGNDDFEILWGTYFMIKMFQNIR